MNKTTRKALAEILARYLVTPTKFDAELLTEAATWLPATDPVRNAIEATMCIGYHDDTATMDYIWSSHDMA